MRYWIAIMVAMVMLTSTTMVSAQDGGCIPGDIAIIPGTGERAITVGGRARLYQFYVPPSYDPDHPAPVVLSLHGFISNPAQQAWFSGWNAVADAHGFIVVYPQGTGPPNRWNAGPLSPVARGVVDVAFIQAVIDQVFTDFCIDPTRIYVNGLSNGGGMTHRIACELADQVAAVGGVAGAYPPIGSACQPSRPMPVMAFHGTADSIVPYDGGGFGRFGMPPVEDWAREWAARNGCDLTPEDLPPVGAVTAVRYGDCDDDAEVILYTVDGGGHTWPGGGALPAILVGETNRDINASELLWQFYEAHPLDN